MLTLLLGIGIGVVVGGGVSGAVTYKYMIKNIRHMLHK